MERLNQEICESLGGILSIEIATTEDPDIFYPIFPIENSGTYKRTRKRNKNGAILQYDCSFAILKGKENEDILDWIDENAEKNFILRITDNNSTIFTVGNTDHPAVLLEEVNPGSQEQDENEIKFNIDCQHPA